MFDKCMEMEEDEEEVQARLQELQLQVRAKVGEEEDEGASGSGEEDLDEDEDEEEEDDPHQFLVAYAQNPEHPWVLSRHHFPSKAGGTPAWLDPVRIPAGKDLNTCGICHKPLEFLLQVYAPIDNMDEAFHRTLFVFLCPKMACLEKDKMEQKKSASEKPLRSVRVFRCQLPRENPYYSSVPPAGNGDDRPTCDGVALCSWCGTWRADKVCGRCKQVRYCGEAHQVKHWLSGHKFSCSPNQVAKDVKQAGIAVGNGKSEALDTPAGNSNSSAAKKEAACVPEKYTVGITSAENTKAWPEFELLVDDEPPEQDVGEGNSGVHQSKEQTLYMEYMRKMGDGMSVTDVQGVEQASREQQHWASFQARLARAPEQVLRYCRSEGAKALWPKLDDQPSDSDIHRCSRCGGPRIFEFQILPQLLYYLKVENEPNSLDWGTISVYSCAASCEVGGGSRGGYEEEYAWVQLETYGG